MIPLTVRSIELGAALDELASDQSAWSQATFGADADRGPIGALRHLQREAEEAERAAWDVAGADEWPDAAVRVPAAESALVTELANCLLLLLDASRRAGFTPIDLVRAAVAKMAINRARTWPKTTGDVPTFHAKPAAEIGGEG